MRDVRSARHMEESSVETRLQKSTPELNAASTSSLTFMVIGCQRCGTTWLGWALQEHPEVFVPADRKIYYYNANYQKGLAWYLSHFQGIQAHHKAVGEVGPHYSQLRFLPRLAQDFPHIKLIMSMRHPIERAYSHYLAKRKNPEKNWAEFEQTLEEYPPLLAIGRYIEQIEAVLEHYPREQLLLLFYDDLLANERKFLRSVLTFIGVDANFESKQFGQRRHQARIASLRKTIGRFGLTPAIHAVRRLGIEPHLRRMLQRSSEVDYTQEIPTSIRTRLAEYYRPFNERLSIHTNRNLDHWNR
jgi:hypothetical protein